MTAAPTLKLVPNDTVDQDIVEIEGDILAAKRDALLKRKKGDTDLLPPAGDVPRYDDLANSKRFLSIIGDDLLYCAQEKRWYTWYGTHWRPDSEDLIFDLAAGFAADLYNSAADKEAFKNAQRANNQSGFNAFLNLAQRRVTVTIDDLDNKDRTERLLNCANGTLELDTGVLRPHAREDRITRRVNCDFNAEAKGPVFDRFLTQIQPDPEIRAFLQRSIGYSLLGSVRERSFWILYGTGNNGKSVFTDLFNLLLSDYAATTTTATIMQGRQNAIPNDIARLKGKRFVVIPETEENERLNASLVKALSAGDTVSARFLFGEYFDFPFSAKLWIATNHKPTITDHSKGMWDRIKLIPFAQDIPADQVIKKDDLMRMLMAEREAVLAWAVAGARDYFERDGLATPQVIIDEIDRYRHEQDSIAQFLAERCQTWPQFCELRERTPNVYATENEFQVANGDLYEAYKKFCNANGEHLRSHRRFTQNMIERGFKQKMSAGRYWEGIRLTSTE